MKNCYLAFDLGATSGRTILGEIEDNKIAITELHRFPNKFIKVRDHYYWNIYNIFEELQNGIKVFSERCNFKLDSIGIDTWGVDFGFLDKHGNILNLPLSYRDHITDGIIEDFTTNVLSADKLYRITGIQFLKFNSLFQLYAIGKENKTLINNADTILFIPDLLAYLFSGVKSTEYTIASTSQMLNAQTKNWSVDLFKSLNISTEIVTDIVNPGTIVGNILPDIADSLNIKPVPLVAVAEHDTGSAIVAVPAKGDNWAYLSSGTWSLMGIELYEPIISDKAMEYGFTNEGGIQGTIRFLKNICGMWLLEQCKKQWDKEKPYTYKQLIQMSEEAIPFQSFINPDADVFANPVNMVDAIREYLVNMNQHIPETIGQIIKIIFESLAMKYRYTMTSLKELSPKPIEQLHVIGGGCRNEMLNRFTANALNMPVLAGPAEATAIGNIMVQAIATKKVSGLKEIRQIVYNSTDIISYTPKDTDQWDKAYTRFLEVTKLK